MNKDIEHVLRRNGFIPLSLSAHTDFGLWAKLKRIKSVFSLLFSIPSNSIVFFQSPLHGQLHVLLVKLFCRFRRNVQVICCITDLDGLRDQDAKFLQKELSLFKQIDSFVVHNELMKTWLLNHVPHAKASTLEFFDYLAEPNLQQRSISNQVVFAGNFSKATFLSHLHEVPELDFLLYGKNEFGDSQLSTNIYYKGMYPAYEVPNHLEGSFGLVWDGDSIDGIEGGYGEYLRWNSPHKLFLYILSALPVICPIGSATESLVGKYGIGFSVASLHGIGERIRLLTLGEYEGMQENCRKLAPKIAGGHCLMAALQAFMDS